jgi:hypothetical protein
LAIDILLKTCTTCTISKDLLEFNKKKSSSDGHRTQCKVCQSVSNKQYAQLNRVAGAERLQNWRRSNPEAVKAQKSRQHANNPTARKEYRKRAIAITRVTAKVWAQNNKDKVLAYGKKARQTEASKLNKARLQNLRRAIKLQATVVWDSELTNLIEREAYHLCFLRKSVTGFRWEVDHIVPLQGEAVCGLHVWNNLACIPASKNASKSNNFNGNIPTGFTI